MARRTRIPRWSASFKRTLGVLARAGQRAVAQSLAATKVAKPRRSKTKVKAKASTARRDRSVEEFAVAPTGLRRYRLLAPAGRKPAEPRPMLVLLHGCAQDAAQIALASRLPALAARAGWLLLLPQQERLANAQGCWNWFDTRSGRAAGEAASIVAAIDQACARHGADPTRIALAGFSAGAGMAALLALRYPTRFSAVAMHSGVAPGAAQSTATALRAMHGRRAPTPLPVGTPLPPLLVIQGTSDAVVNARNGSFAARLWADALGALPGPARTVQRGARRAMTVTDFKRQGSVCVSLCEVRGLGHAWSGGAASQAHTDPLGPDASRLICAFVGRAFANLKR
jgi:poly(hydroxyalkanoate) depolymerase family esterase